MDIKIIGITRMDTALEQGTRGWRLEYRRASGEQPGTGDSGALLIDCWSYEDLFERCGMDEEDKNAFGDPQNVYVQCGGWQSWSAGWELENRERLPRKVPLIPELIKQTNRDGDTQLPWDAASPQEWLTGHFITYIRSGDRYLCIASAEGGRFPPVTYRINRAERRVTAEVYCPGKTWSAGETLAELSVFFARGYFCLKDTLRSLYKQEEPFKTLDFLSGSSLTPNFLKKAGAGKDTLPGGYESWYNHYTDINEELILKDLEALDKTENLIKLWYRDRGKPAVFQIDDGWEKTVGDWDADAGRFPRGLAPVAAKIEAAGYIPGLWLAPFLVTRRSRIFSERPGWLLREKTGEPVAAGFNPLWDRRFYCLDLSRKDVLEYLGRLMDRAINEWGFRYLKLDFLYAGLLNGDFAEGGSPYEHYERACEILTRLPAAYLGCGVPLGPSYRRFPLSRIGADTREEWDWRLVKLLGFTGRASAYISLLDTIGRAFMDGAVYRNDPDVIFLRSRNCKLKEHEKELIALVNFLLGGQIMFSDDPLELEPADIALTRRIVNLYDRLSGDEYGAVRIGREVFRLESRSGRIAGLINLSRVPYALNRQREPALFAAMQAGSFLTDHRLNTEPGMVFAPHTITAAVR